MQKQICQNNCCNYSCNKSLCVFNKTMNKRIFYKKAGIFILDPITNKILLVQSHNNRWGPPKGTVKPHETIKQCAIREVEEETGIRLSVNMINENNKFMYNNANYYYLELLEQDVTTDNPMQDNEINDEVVSVFVSHSLCNLFLSN